MAGRRSHSPLADDPREEEGAVAFHVPDRRFLAAPSGRRGGRRRNRKAQGGGGLRRIGGGFPREEEGKAA